MMPIGDHEIKSIIDWLSDKFEEDSDEEKAARRVLVKVLRHWPPNRGILFILADLIDPDMRDDMGRWLAFKRAQGAKRTMDWRKVSAVIWRELRAGKQQKAAVSIAMEECGVGSRDKALAAYNKWKPIFEKWGSKMKALTRTD
jgi:hypothetical protein